VVNGRDGHARTAVAGAKPHRIINYYVKPHLLITVHVSSTWHQYDSQFSEAPSHIHLAFEFCHIKNIYLTIAKLI
jgi:hypothetical protein